jgi:hypothetical protein
MGLEERVSSYGMMLWTALLAIGLLRAEATPALRQQLEKPTVTRSR